MRQMKIKIPILILLSGIFLFSSCGILYKKEKSPPITPDNLTQSILWDIHQNIRYTYFYYADGSTASGLMLRWQGDSVLVQPRGEDKARKISTSGVSKIKVVLGNRAFESMAIGIAAATGYWLAVEGWQLKGLSIWSSISKIFVPFGIVVAGNRVWFFERTDPGIPCPARFRLLLRPRQKNLRSATRIKKIK